MWLLLWLVVAVLAALAFNLSYSRVQADLLSPVNFFLFQEPSQRYTQDVVNLWIDKPWSSQHDKIPARLELSAANLKKSTQDRPWVVYSHGNGEDLLSTLPLLQHMAKTLGVDLVTYDYAGYGLNTYSRFGRSPAGINATLQAVVDHMEQHGYSRKHLVLWGYSLGTGPSTYLAGKLYPPPRGLVLFAAYLGINQVIRDVAGERVAAGFQERWDTAQNIQKLRCPVLLLHGQRDGMVTIRHSEQLAQHARKAGVRTDFLPLANTGHTNFSYHDVLHPVRAWLLRLPPAE